MRPENELSVFLEDHGESTLLDGVKITNVTQHRTEFGQAALAASLTYSFGSSLGPTLWDKEPLDLFGKRLRVRTPTCNFVGCVEDVVNDYEQNIQVFYVTTDPWKNIQPIRDVTDDLRAIEHAHAKGEK